MRLGIERDAGRTAIRKRYDIDTARCVTSTFSCASVVVVVLHVHVRSIDRSVAVMLLGVMIAV